jgi:hypothetical protein
VLQEKHGQKKESYLTKKKKVSEMRGDEKEYVTLPVTREMFNYMRQCP